MIGYPTLLQTLICFRLYLLILIDAYITIDLSIVERAALVDRFLFTNLLLLLIIKGPTTLISRK